MFLQFPWVWRCPRYIVNSSVLIIFGYGVLFSWIFFWCQDFHFFSFSSKVYLSFGMKHSSHRYENYVCSYVHLKQYFIIVRTHQYRAGPFHQHKTFYRRSPNLPCSCKNTGTEVFLICAFESIFFGPWIYWILHFRNFAQRVNICYILFTNIEKLFAFKRFIIEICYTIECLRKDKICTIFDGRNTEQARNDSFLEIIQIADINSGFKFFSPTWTVISEFKSNFD